MATPTENVIAGIGPITPEFARILGQKYWHHFAIQLGHWNSLKVIVMDAQTFENMPLAAKVELAREFTKFLQDDVMFARDATNEKVWILGPQKVIRPQLSVVDSLPIWDPQRVYAPIEKKLPRPPNAFILFRRDMQVKLKMENPNLTNNEISVLTGQMWKELSPEERAVYQRKADEIKEEFLKMYPNYRYNPRRPEDIRRRQKKKSPNSQGPNKTRPNPSASPMRRPMAHRPQPTSFSQLRAAGRPRSPKSPRPSYASEITHHIPDAAQFLPPFETPGWTPPELRTADETPQAAPQPPAHVNPLLLHLAEQIQRRPILSEEQLIALGFDPHSQFDL